MKSHENATSLFSLVESEISGMIETYMFGLVIKFWFSANKYRSILYVGERIVWDSKYLYVLSSEDDGAALYKISKAS